MKSVVLGILLALAVSPVFAAGRRVRSQPVKIPTVGKATYAIEHPAVAKPSCKDGKCSLRR